MLNFPKSTYFDKRIPKQKFYNNLSISSDIEKLFVDEISSIVWKNKLSEETLNISIGKYVKEIEVIEITLKDQKISNALLEFIDREIPYHIVFVLKYEGMGQICLSFKEKSKNREGKFKVDSYFKTNWMNYNDLFLSIEGLDLDKVYENFLMQVSEGSIETDEKIDVKEAVERAKEKEKLQIHIKRLEKKIRNEKQFNRQVILMGELRKLKKQLENS